MPPRVSVVIPCYNSSWCLEQLAACLTKVTSKECEVIFVDDGSTDDSGKFFSRLFPQAHIVRQQNQGVGAARNYGVSLAQAEYIQVLDADDTIEAGKLEAQADHLDSTGADVVYSDWRMMIVKETETISEPIVTAGNQLDCIEALLSGWWFPNAAGMIRKSAYLRSGGCDPSLRNTCEDFHLWIQLAIHGAVFSYLPTYFANYYRYDNRTTMSHVNRLDFLEGEITIIENALNQLGKTGALNSIYKKAAAIRLHLIARNLFRYNRQRYQELIKRIYILNPAFMPRGSAPYRLTSTILGLDFAEWLCMNWSALKGTH